HGEDAVVVPWHQVHREARSPDLGEPLVGPAVRPDTGRAGVQRQQCGARRRVLQPAPGRADQVAGGAPLGQPAGPGPEAQEPLTLNPHRALLPVLSVAPGTTGPGLPVETAIGYEGSMVTRAQAERFVDGRFTAARRAAP